MTIKLVVYANPPESCDICDRAFSSLKLMFDCKTRGGPWATLCKTCFNLYGIGLGTGLGQEYTRQSDGKWIKTNG